MQDRNEGRLWTEPDFGEKASYDDDNNLKRKKIMVL